MVTRLAPLLAALCVAAMALPAGASAHAQLEGTSPARGATVKAQPDAVLFRFDEPVEGSFGAVRVFDADGERVDSGDAFHPGGSGPRMAVHLKPRLPSGSYTATYRVVSADGHIVSSGFVFSIGHPGASGQTVADLLRGSGTGAATEIAFGVARGLQYVSLAVAVGGLLFLALCWLPALGLVGGASGEWLSASAAFAGRLRRLLLIAMGVGAFSAAAGVVLEGAEAAGVSAWSALSARIVRETLQTRFGMFWALGFVAWLVAGAALVAVSRRSAPLLRPATVGATGTALPARTVPPAALAAIALPLVFLIAIPVASGHAATQSPRGVLVPSVLLHVTGMAAWLGGLVALVVAVPAATRRLEPADRTRLLAAGLSRFSPLALACVIAILASGLVQAYVLVRTPAHLLDTAYGRCVLIKFALLIVVIGLGAYNRRRSVPALRRLAAGGATPGRAGLLLRRALRTEVVVIAAVLAVTAALASYAPAVIADTGPVSRTTSVGPAQLQMTVDPAQVGSNQIHLYLIDPSTGAQFTAAREVTVAASLPSKSIGPIDEDTRKAGPGHYIATNAVLAVKGTWRLRITVRTSRFDQYETTADVPLR